MAALAFLLAGAAPARADAPPMTRAACQSVVASAPWHLLQSRGNTRYASEMLPLHRPSLTFNGFDNTRDGLTPNAGHGLPRHLSGGLT